MVTIKPQKTTLLLVAVLALAALVASVHGQAGVNGKPPTHHWYCKSGNTIFDDDWAMNSKEAATQLEQHKKLCKRAQCEHAVVAESVWQSTYRSLKVVR